jgi:hypothetical protein
MVGTSDAASMMAPAGVNKEVEHALFLLPVSISSVPTGRMEEGKVAKGDIQFAETEL